MTHVLFETGSDELKLMEQKVYVASGRFVIEAGKPPVVEYENRVGTLTWVVNAGMSFGKPAILM